MVAQPDQRDPVQHLAGEMSFEGYQHCIRCGLVLVKKAGSCVQGFPSGYVYQVGGRFRLHAPDEHDPCLT